MKILLVDDNRSLTTLLCRALDQLGYEAYAENNSLSALKTIKKQSPEMVVLDLNMPEKGGIEIYGEMKLDEDLADIPVIMLAPVSESEAVHAETFGCDVINKPAKLEVLLATIDRHFLSSESKCEIAPKSSNSQKREIYENILQ